MIFFFFGQKKVKGKYKKNHFTHSAKLLRVWLGFGGTATRKTVRLLHPRMAVEGRKENREGGCCGEQISTEWQGGSTSLR
jgi:hypothetical protein